MDQNNNTIGAGVPSCWEGDQNQEVYCDNQDDVCVTGSHHITEFLNNCHHKYMMSCSKMTN